MNNSIYHLMYKAFFHLRNFYYKTSRILFERRTYSAVIIQISNCSVPTARNRFFTIVSTHGFPRRDHSVAIHSCDHSIKTPGTSLQNIIRACHRYAPSVEKKRISEIFRVIGTVSNLTSDFLNDRPLFLRYIMKTCRFNYSKSFSIIPGTFWFGRFDVLGKMVQIEEMTELNPSLSGTECGKSIFGEGTVSVEPRREGERIAIATAMLGNEEMGHFPTQKSRSKFEDRSAKIKRVGYRYIIPIIGCLLMFVSSSVFAQDNKKGDSLKAEWSGYLKYLHTTLYQPGQRTLLLDGLVQQRLNLDISNAKSTWSTHLGLRTRMFYGDNFELTPDLGSSIHNDNNDYFDLSLNLIDSKHLLINTYLDRLYMQWTLKSWEIRAGRQRINWGISTFWNPNDLFNSFDFTDFDYEERPGSDALRITWYSGPVSRLEGAIKMADSWEKVTAAMLFRWNSGSFDFQLIGGKYNENITMGGGWSGFLKDLGFKGEFMYFKSYNSNINNTFNLTSGFDYIFGTDFFTSIGYLYNEAGSTDQGINFYTFQLSARNLYPYRHAMYSSINYSFTPLLSGGISVVYSPVPSDPWFISPTLSYNVAQNWDIDFVSQMFVTEFTGINLNSFSYFLRMKWSF